MNEIEISHTAPFLSILIGINNGVQTSEEIHKDVLKILKNEINDEEMITIFSTSSQISGEAFIEFTPYSVKRSPNWLKKGDIYDLENHLFISIHLGEYIAFYFSEKGLKDSIRDYFTSSFLPKVKVVDINHLNYLFINEDRIKMLWLLGIHGKNSFKADSKVLGGNSVADTLDPLEDQSYMMSAVRTSIGNSEKTIGLNPFKSSIWRGPCKDWDTFENNITYILDSLRSNSRSIDNPISILATPINDLNAIKNAYDLSLIDYSILPSEQSSAKKDLLKTVTHSYNWELIEGLGNKKISLRIFHEKILCGELTVEPTIRDYEISFNVTGFTPVKNKKKTLEYFKRIFNHPEFIKCWYETGHAIVNAWLFKTDYRDVQYHNFIWADFENYDITQEKPNVEGKLALDLIGKQKSLFCWVKNRWSGGWNTRDEFNTTEKPLGWLYCDDGAGEKADFIHIVEHKAEILISLIHVKAANANSLNRRISVGAHDIVLNQAIKNLRYVNRKNLLLDLQERAETSENKQCWLNNNSETSKNFTSYLQSIQKISNIKTRVIVIQPHTMKNFYETVKSSNIKKQLDVLLVSADNAIRSSGAEFHILGYHDK
jgi:hypothetical protein